MTYSERSPLGSRLRLGPLIGLSLMFVALGPAIGGVLFAPHGWPCALATAAICAAAAQIFAGWIAGLGADLFGGLTLEISEPRSGPFNGRFLSPESETALRQALDACRAIADGVCAVAANLIGLSPSKVMDGSPP